MILWNSINLIVVSIYVDKPHQDVGTVKDV